VTFIIPFEEPAKAPAVQKPLRRVLGSALSVVVATVQVANVALHGNAPAKSKRPQGCRTAKVPASEGGRYKEKRTDLALGSQGKKVGHCGSGLWRL